MPLSSSVLRTVLELTLTPDKFEMFFAIWTALSNGFAFTVRTIDRICVSLSRRGLRGWSIFCNFPVFLYLSIIFFTVLWFLLIILAISLNDFPSLCNFSTNSRVSNEVCLAILMKKKNSTEKTRLLTITCEERLRMTIKTNPNDKLKQITKNNG